MSYPSLSVALIRDDLAAVGEDLAIDSSRAFLGPNASYYDERWRWMDWTARQRSWNWSAAITFGLWLAYRRLYGWAFLYLLWVGTAVHMALRGTPFIVIALGFVAIGTLLGNYGNALYANRFHRRVRRVFNTYATATERELALAKDGGVSTTSVAVMLMALAGIGTLVRWLVEEPATFIWI